MSEDDVILEATGLRQKFGRTVALHEINLNVRAGESICVIGPNGAGKTTLLFLLGGVYYPTRGEVKVFGLHRWRDNHAIRQRSTFLFAESQFGDSPTPYEFLRFFAQIYGIPKPVFLERVARLSEEMVMAPHLKKPWHKLSRGMKKKAGLIATFLPDAELRIMDEPFTGGIDHLAIEQLYEWMDIGKQRGEAYIFSSQALEHVADAADRIVFLKEGEKIAEGTMAELVAEADIDIMDRRAVQKTFVKLSKDEHA